MLWSENVKILTSLEVKIFFFTKAMRSGLWDVLPSQILEGLTAEDLRLLLCGCQQVDLDILKKITTFSDESRTISCY